MTATQDPFRRAFCCQVERISFDQHAPTKLHAESFDLPVANPSSGTISYQDPGGNNRIAARCLLLRVGGFMVIGWGVFSAKTKKALKTGWLVRAGVVAL
jgi:hypothetical protein